jgi:hypothetical protein
MLAHSAWSLAHFHPPITNPHSSNRQQAFLSGMLLSFNGNTSLTINDTRISNTGDIFLNSAGNNTNLILSDNNAATFSGGGTVTFDYLKTNQSYSAKSRGLLVNQEAIQGAGPIGVGLVSLSATFVELSLK